MFKQAALAAAALATSLAAAPAPAAVIVTFNEVGNDVIGSFSGSFVSALPRIGGATINEVALDSSFGSFQTYGTMQLSVVDIFQAIGPQPGSFDNGTSNGQIIGNNATGDALWVASFGLGVPVTYIWGSVLAGTFEFLNQSFVTMSVLPGTYTYTLYNPLTNRYDGDTVTLQFGTEAAVPLPATMPLLLGTLGVAAVAARRLKRGTEIG